MLLHTHDRNTEYVAWAAVGRGRRTAEEAERSRAEVARRRAAEERLRIGRELPNSCHQRVAITRSLDQLDRYVVGERPGHEPL